jgi:hypothetical protein
MRRPDAPPGVTPTYEGTGEARRAQPAVPLPLNLAALPPRAKRPRSPTVFQWKATGKDCVLWVVTVSPGTRSIVAVTV